MGCAEKRAEKLALIAAGKQLVQLKKPKPKPKPTATATPSRKVDYICTICGHVGIHKEHTCLGPKKIGYVEDRLYHCTRCRYRTDDVCTLYKSQHPERDALISIGVTVPEAACPAGLWPKVLLHCDCGSTTFKETGVTACSVCKAGVSQSCALPHKIVVVEEPAISATSDLLVITIAVGQDTLNVLEYTRPTMEAYAKKCGADFYVVTNNAYPEYPLANKFRLKQLVSNYKRILFLDSDVYVHDSAENLFDIVPKGTIGIHSDRAWTEKPGWVDLEMGTILKSQGIEPVHSELFNTGVVVFDVEHAAIWNPPTLPAKPRYLLEQFWVEYNIISQKIQVTNLDVAYNTQWWMQWRDDYLELLENAKFMHLASCPNAERLLILKKLKFTQTREASITIKRKQPSLDNEMVAVTSLSLLPHHLKNQSTCLDSWVDFGLSIIAVNSPEEIENLRGIYPQVTKWIEQPLPESRGFTSPTQLITILGRTALKIHSNILLINSDIEIYGEQTQLLSKIKDKSIVVGIRQNYEQGLRSTGVPERYGMDAFLITPEMAFTLPDTNFQIGKPVWDYWIPYHFSTLGYEVVSIVEPLFYHRNHKFHWNTDDMDFGVSEIRRLLKSPELKIIDIRQALPHPPT